MASASLPPIVIAEDDPNDLFLVRRQLDRAGVKHPIVTFDNGEDLISFLRAGCIAGTRGPALRPGLLFLDIKMPRCDGFDVLRWVRQQAALRDMKVIVLSGSDEPRDIAQAQQLGADRFLTKYPPPKIFAEIVAGIS